MENIIKTLIYLFNRKDYFLVGNLHWELLNKIRNKKGVVYDVKIVKPSIIREENEEKFITYYFKNEKMVYFTLDYQDSKKGRMKK